jgi:pimeloyl-ACP methyl ester carboxylesterase
VRRILALLLAIACQLLVAAPAQAQQWCPEHAECGELAPSLVDAGPFAATPHVRYAYIRHTQGTGRTVVYNPGGPGVSAIGRAEAVAAFLGPEFDLLTFDPRGAALSGPLDCRMPDDVYLRSLAEQLQAIADCGTYLGTAAASFTTEDAADDLDAIRRHLGIDKLELYGASYGTALMTTYARRHPAHVDAMLLSGPMTFGQDPFGRERARALTRSIERVCARSGGCSGRRLLDDLRTLAGRLARRPLHFVMTRDGRGYRQAFDDSVLAFVMTQASYHPEYWRFLPRVLHEAVNGDPQALVRVAKREYGLFRSVRGSTFMLRHAVMCEDAALPYDRAAPPPARIERLKAELKAIGSIGPFTAGGWSKGIALPAISCLGWPATRAATATGPLPDVPTLIVTGDLDAVTPPETGRALAREIPDAAFIDVPNVGHTPEADRSRCVLGAYWAFLSTTGTPDFPCLRRLPPVPVP